LGKVLLLLVIGFLGYVLFKGFMKASVKKAQDDKRIEGENLVQCMKCGVQMPMSDAVVKDEGFVCRDPANCRHAK
jgi:formylmethanofuran dehydrogenase subunit E